MRNILTSSKRLNITSIWSSCCTSPNIVVITTTICSIRDCTDSVESSCTPMSESTHMSRRKWKPLFICDYFVVPSRLILRPVWTMSAVCSLPSVHFCRGEMPRNCIVEYSKSRTACPSLHCIRANVCGKLNSCSGTTISTIITKITIIFFNRVEVSVCICCIISTTRRRTARVRGSEAHAICNRSCICSVRMHLLPVISCPIRRSITVCVRTPSGSYQLINIS